MQNKERIQGVSFCKLGLSIVLLFVSLSITGCNTSNTPRTMTLPSGVQDRIRNYAALQAWSGRSITEALEIWGEPTYKVDDYLYVWEEISTNVHGTFQCKTEMYVSNGLIRNPSWWVVDDENFVTDDSDKTLGLSFYLINKAPPGLNIHEAFNLE